MSITEALADGIGKVRKPYWNETAFLELPAKTGGRHGPWCRLHDSGRIVAVLIFYADDRRDDWEPATDDARPA